MTTTLFFPKPVERDLVARSGRNGVLRGMDVEPVQEFPEFGVISCR